MNKKDFVYRIKVCRKEAKESGLFLKLVNVDAENELEKERIFLVDEAIQLVKIFNKIIGSSS